MMAIPPCEDRRHAISCDVRNLDDAGYELLCGVIALLTDDAFERTWREFSAGRLSIVMQGGEPTFEPTAHSG